MAEGAAEAAGLVGLDETAAVPGGNGNRNGAVRSSGNGVRTASASSGADTEFGASAENA